jgi:pilus assembly protein Flp/PilA
MRGSLIVMRLLRDDRGATAIEYGLIVALIVIAMLAALGSVGSEAGGLWGSVATKATDAMQT